MITSEVKTNNEHLRELIVQTGLSQPVALTIFNRGLGPAACREDAWKDLLASPETTRFRPLNDALLAHAEKAFENIHKKT